MPQYPYLPWPVFRRSGVAAFRRSLTAVVHPDITDVARWHVTKDITQGLFELTNSGLCRSTQRINRRGSRSVGRTALRCR